jgi:hypothetical protein
VRESKRGLVDRESKKGEVPLVWLGEDASADILAFNAKKKKGKKENKENSHQLQSEPQPQ